MNSIGQGRNPVNVQFSRGKRRDRCAPTLPQHRRFRFWGRIGRSRKRNGHPRKLQTDRPHSSSNRPTKYYSGHPATTTLFAHRRPNGHPRPRTIRATFLGLRVGGIPVIFHASQHRSGPHTRNIEVVARRSPIFAHGETYSIYVGHAGSKLAI